MSKIISGCIVSRNVTPGTIFSWKFSLPPLMPVKTCVCCEKAYLLTVSAAPMMSFRSLMAEGSTSVCIGVGAVKRSSANARSTSAGTNRSRHADMSAQEKTQTYSAIFAETWLRLIAPLQRRGRAASREQRIRHNTFRRRGPTSMTTTTKRVNIWIAPLSTARSKYSELRYFACRDH